MQLKKINLKDIENVIVPAVDDWKFLNKMSWICVKTATDIIIMKF